ALLEPVGVPVEHVPPVVARSGRLLLLRVELSRDLLEHGPEGHAEALARDLDVRHRWAPWEWAPHRAVRGAAGAARPATAAQGTRRRTAGDGLRHARRAAGPRPARPRRAAPAAAGTGRRARRAPRQPRAGHG